MGGGRPRGQCGQAPLPERPGLPGLMEARRPAEVGSPGVAPHLRLAEEGLAGADGAAGRREWMVQPGGGPVSSTHGGGVLQERGFDPKLASRSFLGALGPSGGRCCCCCGGGGGIDGRVRQGALGHVVHLGGLRQAFLLHLLQLLLGQAVAEQGWDDLLGVGLEALAPRGLVIGGCWHAPPVGQRDAWVPGAPRRPITRIREAAARLAQLTDVLLVGVLPAARPVQRVVAGGRAALGGAAQLPPERDEHGGHDDEQAQGYASDRHDVVGLHGSLGLERRWAGWLESYQKKKKKEQMHPLVWFSLHGSKVSGWLALII